MSTNMRFTDVLKSLGLNDGTAVQNTEEASGVLPKSIKDVSIISKQWILGVKPSDFIKEYSSVEVDFDKLKTDFLHFCKDFNDELSSDKPSKALEFSSKILFEFGTMMRSEKKGKGDKAIRFRFPYTKLITQDTGTSSETDKDDRKKPPKVEFIIRPVIVSTFKDHTHKTILESDKMILTIKQATLLAMVTFEKAAKFSYTHHDQSVLLTPLCGAIFSKTSITAMANELKKEAIDVISIINASTCLSGHYLPDSDMACAIVAAIAGTKSMANKGGRDQIITKVIKQYSIKKKIYKAEHFEVFAKYALGGVPQGLDSNSLIENFKNVQAAARVK